MESQPLQNMTGDTFTNTSEKKAKCWTKTTKQQHYSSNENSSDPPLALNRDKGVTIPEYRQLLCMFTSDN